MTPIEEAKDLVLINYFNWATERFNDLSDACVRQMHEDKSTEELNQARLDLLDKIYLTHTAQIQMALFEYWEAVFTEINGNHKDRIRLYQSEFRERIIAFNELIRANEELKKMFIVFEIIEGHDVPDYEHSDYADAVVMVRGKPDRRKGTATRSSEKKRKESTDIVFFEDGMYYSLAVPDEEGNYKEIEKIPYFVPRYVPF